MKLKKEFNIKNMKKFILISSFVLVGLFMSLNVLFAAPNDANPGGGGANGGTSLTEICINKDMKSIEGIINWGTCLLSKSVVPFLFALAVASFIWGVIQFYLNPENEEKRKKGKSFIVGGLIALFVMVSIWGLVGILTNTFETTGSTPELPTLK